MSLNIHTDQQAINTPSYKQVAINNAFLYLSLTLPACFSSLSDIDLDSLYVEMYPAIQSQQPGRLKFGELLNEGVKNLIQNVNMYIDILQILANYKIQEGDGEKKNRFFKKFQDIKPHEIDIKKFIELLHAIANFAVLNIVILLPLLKEKQLEYILQVKDGVFVQMPRAANRTTLPDVNYDSSNFYSKQLQQTISPENQNSLELILTINCGVWIMLQTQGISEEITFGDIEEGAVPLYTLCQAFLNIV